MVFTGEQVMAWESSCRSGVIGRGHCQTRWAGVQVQNPSASCHCGWGIRGLVEDLGIHVLVGGPGLALVLGR